VKSPNVELIKIGTPHEVLIVAFGNINTLNCNGPANPPPGRDPVTENVPPGATISLNKTSF
jgi:hypothetical protein